MRAIAGIVVGLIASAIIAIIVGIVALPATFSLPPGIDASDPNQVVHALKNIPLATQIALAIAWLASAFCGAFLAKLIGRKAWAAWVVALLVAIYFALNALILTQPLWVVALWVVAPLLGGLIGNRLVGDGAAPEASTVEAEDDPADPRCGLRFLYERDGPTIAALPHSSAAMTVLIDPLPSLSSTFNAMRSASGAIPRLLSLARRSRYRE